MKQIPRFLAATTLLSTVVGSGAPVAEAQRGTTSTRPAAAAPAQAAAGYALDFQNQELQVVLNALAEAGNLNVTMTNIPAGRVSVRMGRGAPRDTLVAMIRGLAESNGVRFTAQGSLIRLEGDPSTSPAALQAQQIARQQAAAQVAAEQTAATQQLRLYTHRLKHASAVEVAPVLMNLLGAGGTTIGNTTFLPGGGVQITNPVGGGRGAAVIPPAGAQGGAQGGRGGGAGGAAGAQVQLDQAFGGRGGRGGQGAAQQAIAQALIGGLLNQGGQGGVGGAGTLSNSSAQVRIVAEESTNSLLIRATAADYALLQQLIGGIDLRPLQVLIEVTIAEVQRTSGLNVGLGGTATRRGATANAPRDTVGLLPGNVSARDFIFKLTSGNGSINYLAALNALQSRGDVKVLSLPVIIAQNNKEATLNVGEQRPFVQVNQSVTTGTIPTTVQTVQYIDVGTTLTITPIINPDGYVNMAVNQTNNSATNEVQFSAPVISQREASTQVFLRDGQTTVIGGLAGTSKLKTVAGVPWFSKIPIIGGLFFGNTATTETTNELFLFLTPHIISSDEDIDRLKQSLQTGSELMKDMPVGPRIVPGDSARKPPVDTTRRRPPGGREQ
ncbi:MAG: secretin N-terminal domain-containing protein [Gemmatimonadota bacterium]|nr:secretin N-terminal domain-containing protein [Gemmatimonadota bacterium]